MPRKTKLVSTNGKTAEELIEILQEQGYFIAKTPLETAGQVFRGKPDPWDKEVVRFGVVSDTHLGSRYQQLTHLHSFYALCSRRRITSVFHCGDLCDGEKMYRGQEYEIFALGADAQRKYAINHYPKRKGITTYAISGNHDLSFMKTAGYNLVKAIARQRSDIVYLGDDLAYWKMAKGKILIALMHGRSGNAYAVSYRSQKIVEQLPSGDMKPHFLFLGHYHNANVLPGYRNVECVQMPCFQAQTPYMTAKGLRPMVAGLIVTIRTNKLGLAKVTYEVVPYYVHKKDDF